MRKFVTLFWGFEEVHLYKDVGMIPYYIANELNYDSYIACGEKELSISNEKLGKLKISYIKSIFKNEFLDSIIYIIRNSCSIDALNLYHYSKKTVIYILIYKFINKKGKIYLKLDGGGLKDKYKKKNKLSKLDRLILKKCDLISVETKKLYKYLKNVVKIDNLKYIPNGACIVEKFNNQKKENIICFVGRIGAYEKSVDTLVEAFENFANEMSGWKLYLVGPCTEEFKVYLNRKLDKNKLLKKDIILYGNIQERDKLFEIYNKAKIFCLPSRYESFGIAAVEAMSQGCYLIMSDKIDSVDDITNCGELGSRFKMGDINDLKNKLIEVCSNDDNFFEEKSLKSRNYYKENFNYKNICNKIISELFSR